MRKVRIFVFKVFIKIGRWTKKKWKEIRNNMWWKSAKSRAIKTVAQASSGCIAVGTALEQVNWKMVISVGLVAGVISLLTSVATTLPEVKQNEENGRLKEVIESERE